MTIDDHGRSEPPVQADERDCLLGFLDYQRATLAWKVGGLDADQLDATVAPSALTLGGLMKHMAWVEDFWFSYRLLGTPPFAAWDDADWEANPDWEFTSAAGAEPAELLELWNGRVAASRANVDGLDLDRVEATGWPDGTNANLRWIVTHMIEEYARHNGHADLLRESIDGELGE